MASRIVAQLLVAGATTLLRAGTQAWQQALANAHKTGVAQEAVKGAIKSATSMSAAEARQILEVQENVPWVQVTKRYKHLFDQNKKYGSFYLQSKVYRAWEALEQEYVKADKLTNEDRAAAQQILQQDSSEQQQQ